VGARGSVLALQVLQKVINVGCASSGKEGGRKSYTACVAEDVGRPSQKGGVTRAWPPVRKQQDKGRCCCLTVAMNRAAA